MGSSSVLLDSTESMLDAVVGRVAQRFESLLNERIGRDTTNHPFLSVSRSQRRRQAGLADRRLRSAQDSSSDSDSSDNGPLHGRQATPKQEPHRKGKLGTPTWRLQLSAEAAAGAARMSSDRCGPSAAAATEDTASVCSQGSARSLLQSARHIAASDSPARLAAPSDGLRAGTPPLPAQAVDSWDCSTVRSTGSARSTGGSSVASLVQSRLASHHRAVQRAMRGVNAQLYRSGGAALAGLGASRGFVLTPQRPQGTSPASGQLPTTASSSPVASPTRTANACCQTSPTVAASPPRPSSAPHAAATPSPRKTLRPQSSATSRASGASPFTEVSDLSSVSGSSEPCSPAPSTLQQAPTLRWGAGRTTAPASAAKSDVHMQSRGGRAGPSVAFLAARALAQEVPPPPHTASSAAQPHRSLMARAAALMQRHTTSQPQHPEPGLPAAAPAEATWLDTAKLPPQPSAPPMECTAPDVHVDPQGMRRLLREWTASPHRDARQQQQQQQPAHAQSRHVPPPPPLLHNPQHLMEPFDFEACALLNPTTALRGAPQSYHGGGWGGAAPAPAHMPPSAGAAQAYHGGGWGGAAPAPAHMPPPHVPRTARPQRVKRANATGARRQRGKAPTVASVSSASSGRSAWSRIPAGAAAQLSTEQLIALSSATLGTRGSAGAAGPRRKSRKAGVRVWR